MQQIDGAQVVGRDRRIVSAKWSALHSMLDEAATMFPSIELDFAAAVVAEYDQEIILDDDNEQWYAINPYQKILANRLQTQNLFHSLMVLSRRFSGATSSFSQASVCSGWSAHESWGKEYARVLCKSFKVNLTAL